MGRRRGGGGRERTAQSFEQTGDLGGHQHPGAVQRVRQVLVAGVDVVDNFQCLVEVEVEQHPLGDPQGVVARELPFEDGALERAEVRAGLRGPELPLAERVEGLGRQPLSLVRRALAGQLQIPDALRYVPVLHGVRRGLLQDGQHPSVVQRADVEQMHGDCLRRRPALVQQAGGAVALLGRLAVRHLTEDRLPHARVPQPRALQHPHAGEQPYITFQQFGVDTAQAAEQKRCGRLVQQGDTPGDPDRARTEPVQIGEDRLIEDGADRRPALGGRLAAGALGLLRDRPRGGLGRRAQPVLLDERQREQRVSTAQPVDLHDEPVRRQDREPARGQPHEVHARERLQMEVARAGPVQQVVQDPSRLLVDGDTVREDQRERELGQPLRQVAQAGQGGGVGVLDVVHRDEHGVPGGQFGDDLVGPPGDGQRVVVGPGRGERGGHIGRPAGTESARAPVARTLGGDALRFDRVQELGEGAVRNLALVG